jgi:hypothetical protein
VQQTAAVSQDPGQPHHSEPHATAVEQLAPGQAGGHRIANDRVARSGHVLHSTSLPERHIRADPDDSIIPQIRQTSPVCALCRSWRFCSQKHLQKPVNI